MEKATHMRGAERRRIRALAMSAGLVLVACGGQEDGSPPTRANAGSPQRVAISGVAFAPSTITVKEGTTVTWVNQDPVEHTVTSGRQAVQGVPGVSGGEPARPSGMFDATLERSSERFSFTFKRAGRYQYYCRVHAGMKAVVVVE